MPVARPSNDGPDMNALCFQPSLIHYRVRFLALRYECCIRHPSPAFERALRVSRNFGGDLKIPELNGSKPTEFKVIPAPSVRLVKPSIFF